MCFFIICFGKYVIIVVLLVSLLPTEITFINVDADLYKLIVFGNNNKKFDISNR